MNKTELLNQANEQNKQWKQYRNHWDNWEVVRVVKPTKTKMGLATQVGDFVLVNPNSAHRTVDHPLKTYRTKVFVTVYSWRTNIDTSVELKSLEGFTPSVVKDEYLFSKTR